jgi:hypothetical protein
MRGALADSTDMMEMPQNYDDGAGSMVTAPPVDTGNNMQNNTQFATSPGSVYWLFLVTVIYVAWGYWQNREGYKESLKLGSIKMNLHNIVGITLAVIIGINFIQVFLTKLAAMRIPVLSKTAGTFLPLAHF